MVTVILILLAAAFILAVWSYKQPQALGIAVIFLIIIELLRQFPVGK